MSFSLKYNNLDLGVYGLRLITSDPAFGTQLNADIVQLPDKAYAPPSIFPAKPIKLEIVVVGANNAELKSFLGSIKRIVSHREAKQLILDTQNDRYWMARFERLAGEIISPVAFLGELIFSADDPLAYSISETNSTHNIDANPTIITKTVGGTAYVNPVYTLTAGENLVDITLLVENTDTEEELQWEGSLDKDKTLEIDVEHWIVKKEGVASMATVSGQFPRLIPGRDNHIKVTNFLTAPTVGTLKITYREAYL